MLADLIGDLIGGMLGDSLARVGFRRAWARKAERRQVLSGVRLLSGSQRGISREWRVGYWSVAPSRMSLEGIEVTVLGIVAGSDRPARLSELLAGAEDTTVVILRTASAELEWSLMKRLEDVARRFLAVPEAEPSS
ncbi:hypothetical protein [Microbacterium rhizosphaerae]|uniref:Uncharacterized protein n=1 Tax=Microbacterium rhizosphaerae TaxID=1678237 RepID=A0ABZ0SLE8_9MICO|nr:hypothetical protein [Microbacterium rhizosphaerae]WPR88517.1 hypothetical protein SM116_12105 [Microbacterium rhizosphaerae]